MLGQAEYVCVLSFQTRKVVVSCLAQILLSLRTSLRSRCITRSRPGSSAVRSFSRCHIGIWGISKVAKSQIIAGLLEKISGAVRFLDHPVEGPDRYRGVVFQTPVLYPWLNVHDNVASGPRMRGLPTKEMERAVDRALELVSLGDFGGHKPYDLSGGMRQRGQGLLKL